MFLCLPVQDEKMNVEALSRAELLTLLSILEGELEAQDVVIHALRVSQYTKPSHTDYRLRIEYEITNPPQHKSRLFCVPFKRFEHYTLLKECQLTGRGCVNRKLRKQGW